MTEPETTERGPGFWARVLAGVAESYLRETTILIAVLVAMGTGVRALVEGGIGWTIVGIVFGVGGLVAVLAAVIKRWPIPRQWAVFGAVLAAEIGLLVVLNQG